MQSDSLHLQPHVHTCYLDRFWVFLDEVRDGYLCVDAERFAPLVPSLSGFERFALQFQSSSGSASEEVASGIASSLIAGGVLATGSGTGHGPQTQNLPRPKCAIESDSSTDVWSLWAHLPIFLKACARADFSLRKRKLSDITRKIRARRAGLASLEATSPTVRRLVSIFNQLRPCYPRSYLCMFDSLAMLDFLATWHIYPDWVFGVTVDPFEAHCWLQTGDALLCDTVDLSSSKYTPIMVL